MGERVLLKEPGEEQFGSCSAIRAGERVFVSGLTADGATASAEFRGAASKVMNALGSLGSSLDDVVRTRIFYIRSADHSELGKAHGELFVSVRPAMSLTQVQYLPGGASALLEAEAIRGAAPSKRAFAAEMPNADSWGYSGVVQVGGDLWVAGVTALRPDGNVAFAGDLAAQSLDVSRRIISMIERCGGQATDIVSTRHYTAVAYADMKGVAHRFSLMHPHHPTSAGITVQGVGPRQASELIEVEAVIGATAGRSNRNTGRPYEEEHHYSRSVRMGDAVYVSGTTSVRLDEEVGSPFDAYEQTIQALDWIRWGIENQGLPFSDLARTRTYVVGDENLDHVARGLRDYLGDIRPAATVVGVPALGRPSILVEIEATAVRGAAA